MMGNDASRRKCFSRFQDIHRLTENPLDRPSSHTRANLADCLFTLSRAICIVLTLHRGDRDFYSAIEVIGKRFVCLPNQRFRADILILHSRFANPLRKLRILFNPLVKRFTADSCHFIASAIAARLGDGIKNLFGKFRRVFGSARHGGFYG